MAGVHCNESMGHKRPRHMLGYWGWQRHMEMAWEMPHGWLQTLFPSAHPDAPQQHPSPACCPQVLLLCLGPSWELSPSLTPNQSQTQHVIIHLHTQTRAKHQDLSELPLL